MRLCPMRPQPRVPYYHLVKFLFAGARERRIRVRAPASPRSCLQDRHPGERGSRQPRAMPAQSHPRDSCPCNLADRARPAARGHGNPTAGIPMHSAGSASMSRMRAFRRPALPCLLLQIYIVRPKNLHCFNHGFPANARLLRIGASPTLGPHRISDKADSPSQRCPPCASFRRPWRVSSMFWLYRLRYPSTSAKVIAAATRFLAFPEV